MQHRAEDNLGGGNGFLSENMSTFRSLVKLKALLPLLVNQSGSAVYYYLLGSEDISLAVPICNSMTFIFTAITSIILGEKIQNPLCCFSGALCIIIGTTLCILS
ncbi:unnamed protein product [Heterosigma akashiwo]|mmetsp:Transcript_39095/g.64344  ORF Transcript_39095/g.64344 Transcript_39095/m.64344 type:complete len:104 (-) Transcript_39095:359-670(-)